MGNLIEEISLRDRKYVFKDRSDAGRFLSQKLLKYKGSDSIILSIPSGGVPVAFEIMQALSLPMDLIIVRKIQIPNNPEAGFGAMSSDGEVILNESLLNQIGLTKEEITTQIRKTEDVIKKRGHIFRGDKPFPSIENKNVFIERKFVLFWLGLFTINSKATRNNKMFCFFKTASKRFRKYIKTE